MENKEAPMKKIFRCSFLLLLSILVFSCAGPPKQADQTMPSTPGWVETGGSRQFPSDLYITGVGSADVKYGDTPAAQAEADSKAMAQVAKQIEVVIQQLSSSFEREVSTTSGGSLSQKDIWEKTAAYVKIKVEGVRIESRHYDKPSNRMYSLAVLDRMAQGKLISDEISALKSNAAALVLEAEKSQQQLEKVHRSIAAYGLALNKLLLALRKNQYLGIIAPRMTHRDIPAALSNLQQDATALMSHFSFQTLRGDNQKGIVGGNLPEPLQMKVFYQGSPVPSVPVTFDFVDGSGNIDRFARSTPEGVVSTSVSNLGPTGEKINKIRAFINIYPSDRTIQKELAAVIPPNYNEFTYELPPVEEIRVAVHINEYNLGYQQHDSYLKNKIIRALGESNLQVMKDIPREYMLDDYDMRGGAKLGQKLKKLSAIADIGIIGEVRATLLDTSVSSSLIFARARAVVKIYDLASNTELGNVDISLKGAGPDRDEAGRRTLEKISDNASRAVEKEIRRTLFGE
jgi:hypothetical protein